MSQRQGETQHEQDIPTILVVEDDPAHTQMFQTLFGLETAYRLLCMQNATEVFQRLEEVKACKPVLLILDYRLPTPTGLELYDALQGIQELAALPTLIMTAARLDEVVQQVGQWKVRVCGKPFDIDVFFTLIEQMLRAGP